MNNWKLVSFVLAATGALVLSAACSSSSSDTGTAGAGGSGTTGLGVDCTAYQACCATYPAASQQACNDALAMYAKGEMDNPGSVQQYEDACKSAVTSSMAAGYCGSGGAGGAGGSGTGGSGGGTAGDAADDLGTALGLDAACVSCIKTMCAAEVTACDADQSATNCASAIKTLGEDHTMSATTDVNCFVDDVGTVVAAANLVTCVADSTKCGTAAGATTAGTCSLITAFDPSAHKTDMFMCK